jgi:ring-1,2-phenylacetyl-CoA epoxidase subunit PaaC
MSASISVRHDPATDYLLRIGDSTLVLAQRLAEWSGRAPVTEEDIALSNMALDLLGQARGLLTRVGRDQGLDEDQLAFLRDERDYRNLTLVELPRGDFAFTVMRNAMMATWLRILWQRLTASSDSQVAGIAGKAVKEARYHQEHAGDWVVRLGDGTEESARRLRAALDTLWRYTPELFDDDEVDAAAATSGLGPRFSELREPWLAEMAALLVQAGLGLPEEPKYRSDGKRGRHSEHMGFLLAEMQYLQRAYPGGVW